MIRPEERAGHVLRQLRRLVLVHPDFLLDDAALALDLGGGKRRAQEHVGQHVDHGGQVRGAGPRVVTRHLLRREGVEITAHAFNGFGNLAGRPLGRSLEEHVFEEMEDAVLALRFLPPADAKPEADGDALDMRHVRHGELRSLIESFLSENHASVSVQAAGVSNPRCMIYI